MFLHTHSLDKGLKVSESLLVSLVVGSVQLELWSALVSSWSVLRYLIQLAWDILLDSPNCIGKDVATGLLLDNHLAYFHLN